MITRRNLMTASAALMAWSGHAPSAIARSASMRDPLLEYDGIGLASLVKLKEVTPRELVEASIRRVEALDGKLNAITTRMFDHALRRADHIVPGGPFAGVPFALKDNTDYRGVKTTHGSSFYREHVAAGSAPLVAAHEAAGLNIIGKTNMPEVGIIPSTESRLLGACHNPWSLTRSAGGSSGGSAAAVAAGYMPLAHATDGGGSIRIPASCCGVFGLKPSRRRMIWGSTNQADFAVDHCVSRTVRDSALLFAITQDRSPDAPYRPLEFVSGPSDTRLKIGLSLRNYFGNAPHPDVQAAIAATARLCESLGHRVVEVENPVSGQEFEEHFFTLFSTRLAQLVDQVQAATGQPATETLDRFTYDFGARGSSLTADDASRARQYMTTLSRQMTQWMHSVDLLLTPVLSTPPPVLGYLFDQSETYDVMSRRVFDYLPYTPLHNALGMPAMSMPLSMSQQNLPIGSHFIARAGGEQTLLELAYELEQAVPWAHRWAPDSAAHL